jgi:hypothetical protein
MKILGVLDVLQQHDHEWQRQAVIDAGLDVEQVPQPLRHLLVAH